MEEVIPTIEPEVILDNNVFNRQLGIIHPDKLKMPILIVGAGSIGGWTALALSKLGCQDITVMDFDTVEEHNAGSQVYVSADEELPKVEALQNRLRFLTEYPIKTVNARWTPDVPLADYEIVIAAVDNITVRTEMFKKIMQGHDGLFIDARMAANSIEIFTVNPEDEADINAYLQTLFAEEDTLPIPCSERSVVYNVFVVAGLITDIVAKRANQLELPRELIVDLYNFTLFK